MKNIASKAILSAATVGLALAPVAAIAKTRAGDSGVSTSASAPGMNRAAKGSKASGEEVVLGLLALAAAVGGIVIATQGSDPTPVVPPPPPPPPPASPGA